jgi:hypothetical protein
MARNVRIAAATCGSKDHDASLKREVSLGVASVVSCFQTPGRDCPWMNRIDAASRLPAARISPIEGVRAAPPAGATGRPAGADEARGDWQAEIQSATIVVMSLAVQRVWH